MFKKINIPSPHQLWVVPIQFLGPAQKGRNEKGDLLLASANRSGLKLSGSGHKVGSLCIAYTKSPISVPSGNL